MLKNIEFNALIEVVLTYLIDLHCFSPPIRRARYHECGPVWNQDGYTMNHSHHPAAFLQSSPTGVAHQPTTVVMEVSQVPVSIPVTLSHHHHHALSLYSGPPPPPHLSAVCSAGTSSACQLHGLYAGPQFTPTCQVSLKTTILKAQQTVQEKSAFVVFFLLSLPERKVCRIERKTISSSQNFFSDISLSIMFVCFVTSCHCRIYHAGSSVRELRATPPPPSSVLSTIPGTVATQYICSSAESAVSTANTCSYRTLSASASTSATPGMYRSTVW